VVGEYRASHATKQCRVSGPPDPGSDFDPNTRAQINVVRREVEWLNSIHVGPGHQHGRVGLPSRGRRQQGVFHTARHVPSVFFEQQFGLDRLFLTGGVRNEDDSVLAAPPRARTLPSSSRSGQRASAERGDGFSCPHLYDLFFPTSQPTSSRAQHVVGRRRRPKLWQGRIRLGCVLHNDFTNLITVLRRHPTAPFGGPVNVGWAARRASSSRARPTPAQPRRVHQLTYTETRISRPGGGYPATPAPVNIGLTWSPSGGCRSGLSPRGHPAMGDFGEVYNSGSTRVDLVAPTAYSRSTTGCQGLDLILRVQTS